jgi:ABC-2 type transport system permease protein
MADPQTTYRVAVTAPAPPGLDAALERAAQPFDDTQIELRVVPSPAVGRRVLDAEEVDALLLLSEDRLVFRSDVDARAAAVADSGVRALRRRLPPEPELTTSTLRPPEQETTDAATVVAYAGSILLLMSLAFYGQWVITGIVEEKNNRVVELILSTVRARHLLAGKVIGIGLLGFGQLALVAGVAAGLLAAGVFDAPAELGGDMALVIPWFALGFALTPWRTPSPARSLRANRMRRRPASRSRTRSSRSTSPDTSLSRSIRGSALDVRTAWQLSRHP